MGIAGLKEDSVAYVIFEGPNENYPKWFSSSIMTEVYVDEFGYTIMRYEEYPKWFSSSIMTEVYADDFGITKMPYRDMLKSVRGDIYLCNLVEGDDTFLLNSRGDIFRTTVDNFDFSYERIDDRYAVIKGREVEYIYYSGDDYELYPDWFEFSFRPLERLGTAGHYYVYNPRTFNIVIMNAEKFKEEYVAWDSSIEYREGGQYID